jgi:hypothetical protein
MENEKGGKIANYRILLYNMHINKCFYVRIKCFLIYEHNKELLFLTLGRVETHTYTHLHTQTHTHSSHRKKREK